MVASFVRLRSNLALGVGLVVNQYAIDTILGFHVERIGIAAR